LSLYGPIQATGHGRGLFRRRRNLSVSEPCSLLDGR